MERYHGGTFSGNDCITLLENIDKLMIESYNCSEYGFINTFVALKRVVHACFGYNLRPDYKEKIQEFRLAVQGIGIRITPKLHVIFHHVEDYCEAHGRGLGQVSEQASESVHCDFKKTWDRHAVSNVNDRYGQHAYSSKRLLQHINYCNDILIPVQI